MTRRLLFLLLLLFAPGLLWAAERNLIVIHTNDFHGHIRQEAEYAGAARIAALVKQTRAHHDGVLVLDAGDSISGTPVSTLFKGAPIFEVMNMIGYDAGALGNHEFDYGYERIEKFREIADFPLLCSNAFAPTGDLIADAPTLIKQVNGIRVAIIGLITEETPDIVTPTGNDGIMFAPPMYSLAAIARAVRPHVDLVILLSHLGHEEDRRLAKEVDGVDLIVGGHSHDLVEPERAGRTLIVQANRYGTHVGYLDMMVDTDNGGITEFDGRLIPAADLPPPDPDVEKAVNDWEAKVEATVDVVIGTAGREFPDEELLPLIESILARRAGTRFGFYNLGGIRDGIRPGEVTARHIWNIEPFGNTLVTVTTDGATLRAIVAMDGATHEGVGRIDDGATYTFATSSFVAALAKRRSPDRVSVSDQGVLVRDLLIDYIRQNGLE